MNVALLAPDGLAGESGGTLYDRQIAERLRARGHTVDAVATAGRSPAALRRDPRLVAADVWLEDELGHADCLALHREPGARPKAVAIVHIPAAILDEQPPGEIERAYLASIDAAVFPSHTMRRDTEAMFGPIAVPWRVIEPGSDHLPLAPRAALDGPLRVIAVAHALPHKRHAWVIDAVDRARSALGEDAIELELWAGSAIPDELAARVAALGAGATVRGRGEPADIATALARADVFVLSSRYESYGIAAAEALRAGAVVVSCARGGCREFLRDGENARVVGDHPDHIADALIALARDRDELARLAGQVARSRLSTWDAAAGAFESFLAEVATPLASPRLRPNRPGRARQ